MLDQWRPTDDTIVFVADGDRPAGAVISAEVVELMRAKLPSQTKESVMDTFGISANTWLKIKRGVPIRRSTAELLIARLARRTA